MLTFDEAIIEQDDFLLTANLTVPAGAHVAVMGPSGAGKSTLMSAIAGFLPLSAGGLFWRGEPIGHLPPAARPAATIFQDNNLFPHLSAARNVGLGLSPNGRSSDADRARIDDALQAVGLAGLGDRLPSQLSGGQQSRVVLARAVLQDRPILLLDEPFAALGPALKSEMIALVSRLAQDHGRTLLMVTHEPADARALGGETILVADGVAHPPWPTTALLKDPPDALAAYLGKDGLLVNKSGG